jgi:uncharacterized alpha-E superfamily protein
MLSRIADSLFWMARYMDRAEHAARLLDVTYHMLLEQSQQTYELRWDAVIKMTGGQEPFYRLYADADPDKVCEYLLFRNENPNSIVNCITNVRENARTIRDRISRELWENVNGLYHRVGDMRLNAESRTALLAGLCTEIISASHTFNGISDSTLPHDEGWQFLQAGRALERAESTARVVDVEYHKLVETSAPGSYAGHQQWVAVLKSVAAYEMYRRVYHSSIEPQSVAELLVLHPQHPRAIRFNIGLLQGSLRAISGAGPHSYSNEAERLTGKLHDSLVYNRIEDVFDDGLHVFLTDVELSCRSIGEQIASTYFYYYAGVA